MIPTYKSKKNKDQNASVERRTELFKQLIEPNVNLVFRLSIRFTNNPQDIEENYSECLTNLFRYIHTYNPEKSLANWIFICCKRLIYDLNRKRGAWKTTDDLCPDDIISHYSESNSEASGNCMGLHNFAEYFTDDVLKALTRLKPIYREARLLQQEG